MHSQGYLNISCAILPKNKLNHVPREKESERLVAADADAEMVLDAGFGVFKPKL